ncbi:unnamed protein product [Closterium sp. NIES-54]
MELSQASGAATCTAVVVTSALVAAGVAAFSSGALSRTAAVVTAGGAGKEATNSRSDAVSTKASKAMDGVVAWLPAEIATSLDDFPFFLKSAAFPSCHSPVIYLLSKSLNLTDVRVSSRSKKTRELLTASAGRTFLREGASKRSHSITVRGPEGSVRYQAELCKGLAKKFDAALFLLDGSFVHLLSQVPGSVLSCSAVVSVKASSFFQSCKSERPCVCGRARTGGVRRAAAASPRSGLEVSIPVLDHLVGAPIGLRLFHGERGCSCHASGHLQDLSCAPSDLPGGERGWLCGSAGPDLGEAGGGPPWRARHCLLHCWLRGEQRRSVYLPAFVLLSGAVDCSFMDMPYVASSSLTHVCMLISQDVHAASYSDVQVCAPKESEKVRAWEAMLKEQSHYMVCERNLQAIILALKARKVTWDEDVADAQFNFTASLAPDEVEDMINMALSEQMLAARTNAQLHVTRDRLEYSLSLFFDEDGACHEKTAVTNGQVVQGKEPVAVHKAVLRVGIPKADEGAGSKVGTPRGDAVKTPRAAEALAAKIASPKVATPKKPAPAPALAAASDDNDFEKRIRPEILAPGSIGVTFESIGALESVKESLRELVLVPLKHPEIFNKGGLLQACKGILLFGPPGTGKTMLAKAVATECGASFINVSMSTITSKWFGEDEKNVRALFTLAEKVAPTVIFIDEVDSMLGQRKGAGEHEAMRKIKNEFMTHWDGLASKAGSRVLVLAATNRPFDLDEAIIRRFQRRIMVGLPDTGNRELILRSILKHEHVHADVDYRELAQLTEGFSGSDLKTLCTAAAYGVLREALAAADGSASEEALELRPLTLEDFREGKNQVSASVAGEAQSMQELKEWNNLYGEGGNRKKATLSYFL